ncbi:hypothetical protein, partial [Treponema socranskii]
CTEIASVSHKRKTLRRFSAPDFSGGTISADAFYRTSRDFRCKYSFRIPFSIQIFTALVKPLS